MDYKFTKKPVQIEAFQMTLERRWENKDWPQWLHEAWNKNPADLGAVYPNGDGSSDDLVIRTKEGAMKCPINHFVIQGVEDELYSCDPIIFWKTYDI